MLMLVLVLDLVLVLELELVLALKPALACQRTDPPNPAPCLSPGWAFLEH